MNIMTQNTTNIKIDRDLNNDNQLIKTENMIKTFMTTNAKDNHSKEEPKR